MSKKKKDKGSINPVTSKFLLKQYDILWANIRHNEIVRDRLYNFYLVAFSILLLGAFNLISIRKEILPCLPELILIMPFLVIVFVGIITIAIQSRLRMVLNRDATGINQIREYFIKKNVDVEKTLLIYNKYFNYRPKSKFHKTLNLNRLIIYLVIGSITFSSGIGTFIVTYDILLTIILSISTLFISLAVSIIFEKEKFYFSKAGMSKNDLY